MDTAVRHKTIAVAVVMDEQHRCLLWNNKRWGGYAFPMKHFDPLTEGDAAEDPAMNAAWHAIDDQDFPLDLPGATMAPLVCTGLLADSAHVNEKTYYDYYVFEVRPSEPLDPNELDPDLCYFSWDELQEALNVTDTTKAIAEAVYGSQDVAVAVISRQGAQGREFLLVYKGAHYQYFFPCTRIKTDSKPEELARDALQSDTAYGGEVRTTLCGSTEDVHLSRRFGAGRNYQYYLCRVELPDVDLNASENAFEKALSERAKAGPAGAEGYYRWFTVDEMRSREDMSPSMKNLVLHAVHCAESK